MGRNYQLKNDYSKKVQIETVNEHEQIERLQKAIELAGEYYKDHYGSTGKYNRMSSDKHYSDDFLKWYYDEDEDEDEEDDD